MCKTPGICYFIHRFIYMTVKGGHNENCSQIPIPTKIIKKEEFRNEVRHTTLTNVWLRSTSLRFPQRLRSGEKTTSSPWPQMPSHKRQYQVISTVTGMKKTKVPPKEQGDLDFLNSDNLGASWNTVSEELQTRHGRKAAIKFHLR